MKEVSKKAFRKAFIPKRDSNGWVVYVCQKCGKVISEEKMCEKEFSLDKF